MSKLYNNWDDFFKNIKSETQKSIDSGINELTINKIFDLDFILSNMKFKILNKKSNINVVIPFRNREKLLVKTIDSIIKNNYDDFSITVVEYSESPSELDIFNSLIVNHIWIPSKKDEFNKSLCMNIGSVVVDSEYIIFHDSDFYVKNDFLNSVLNNVIHYKTDFIQCFSDDKILTMDEEQTLLFFEDDDFLNKNENKLICPYSSPPPGGSLLVKKELFNSVGGYDANLIENWGYEDGIFQLKIQEYTKKDYIRCDNPDVSIFHMYHEKCVLNDKNLEIYEKINEMDSEIKLKFISKQKENFDDFRLKVSNKLNVI
jgi:glycosyltransferase involved in cell wall biosynthesis